ncbi:hypothetical protein SAMN04488514_104171 [Kriegella aquimaris]|uniref:Uncharacterized protein n=1 Tax=Kriegella aquimaris TaxID=192904 RepID=A0A1G9PX27_9FLAO|nr:hypothetical protein SAMN04488514_104171 [Kriegella aquimaris]
MIEGVSAQADGELNLPLTTKSNTYSHLNSQLNITSWCSPLFQRGVSAQADGELNLPLATKSNSRLHSNPPASPR